MREPRIIRRVLYTPYQSEGPAFLLTLVDPDQGQDIPYREPGKYMLAYRLEQVAPLPEKWTAADLNPEVEHLLFAGMDFGVPPAIDIESPVAAHALMMFLCLSPGDVDDKYFEVYNEKQKAFSENHAATLAQEVETWYQAQCFEGLMDGPEMMPVEMPK